MLPSKFPFKKRSRLNYRIVLTVVFAFLFFATLILFLNVYSGGKTPPKIPTSSTTTTTTDSVKGSGKLAFIKGRRGAEGADIWIAAADGSGKQKLTNSGHIGELFSWSPDNKYILVSTNEGVPQNPKVSELTVIDVQTGKEITLQGTLYGVVPDLVWTKDEEITYINEIEMVVYRVTIAGEKLEISRLPTGTESLNTYHFNKAGNKIIYNTSGPDTPGNIYVYDLIKKQRTLISEFGTSILGWIGDNGIYQKRAGLWSISSDGKIKKKLAALDKRFGINASAIARDGTKIFFVVDTGVSRESYQGTIFVYNNQDSKVIELTTIDYFPRAFSVSRDSRFGVYTPVGNLGEPTTLLDLNSGKKTVLCESSCVYAVWQN